MRLIDLSVAMDNDVPADPPFQRLGIRYTLHREGAAAIAGLFPGLSADDLPEGLGGAVENVTLSTHNGTHVDALRPYDIVLMNTAAGAAYGDEDYIHRGCGFGRDATLYLTDRGVRVVGTDAWSWDAPFLYTARRYAETGDASLIWEGHKAGMAAEYCQIEKLHNLDQLPPTGFTVSCFPTKIARASAGWTRAVAILEDG
jgi:kynurenine formamidase